MIQKHVLLTGATGFVGAALLKYLLDQNYRVSVLSRRPIDMVSADLDVVLLNDLEALCEPDSTAANVVASKLQDIDCVVHCAGLAHNLNEANSVEPFYRINRDVTAALARLAADAGVKRFIFISTIGVNGNETRSNLNPDLPEQFTASDIPNPHNDYAVSKLQAEELLLGISQVTSLEVTIIRPPLIYGENAKGNFALLAKVIAKKIPLPFATVKNQRSILAIDNLIDFIDVCIRHPKAANQTFLVADGDDVSTADLLKQVASGMRKKVILLPFPVKSLVWMAKMLGKQQMAISLVGSLSVDTSKARKLLSWQPVVTLQQQLGEMFSEQDGGCSPARK